MIDHRTIFKSLSTREARNLRFTLQTLNFELSFDILDARPLTVLIRLR